MAYEGNTLIKVLCVYVFMDPESFFIRFEVDTNRVWKYSQVPTRRSLVLVHFLTCIVIKNARYLNSNLQDNRILSRSAYDCCTKVL